MHPWRPHEVHLAPVISVSERAARDTRRSRARHRPRPPGEGRWGAG